MRGVIKNGIPLGNFIYGAMGKDQLSPCSRYMTTGTGLVATRPSLGQGLKGWGLTSMPTYSTSPRLKLSKLRGRIQPCTSTLGEVLALGVMT